MLQRKAEKRMVSKLDIYRGNKYMYLCERDGECEEKKKYNMMKRFNVKKAEV